MCVVGNSCETKVLQDQVLNESHVGNPGVVRMKSLARLHDWLLNISRATRGWSKCKMARNRPQQASLHPWDWPGNPWNRIHVDFAGNF